MKKFFLILLLVLPFKIFCMDNPSNFKSHLTKVGVISTEVALAAGISYCGILINTLCHEMGHAMVLKCFVKEPVSIYLGGNATINDACKQQLINFIGFDPLRGSTIAMGSNPPSSLENILRPLAGPIVGLGCAFLQHYLLKKQNFLPELTKKFGIHRYKA